MSIDFYKLITDQQLINYVAVIISTLGIIVALIAFYITLVQRKIIGKKIKQVRRKRTRAIVENWERELQADNIGQRIKDLGCELRIYVNGIPERGPEITKPFLSILLAIKSGMLDEATDILVKVRELSLDNQSLSAIYHIIGNVYLRQSKYIEGREYYSKSFTICEADNNEEGMCWALNGLGLSERLLQDFEKSQLVHEKGLFLANKLDIGILRIVHLGNISEISRRLSDFEKAMEYAEIALKIAIEMNDTKEEAYLLSTIARIQLDLGLIDKASENTDRALGILDSEDPTSNKAALLDTPNILQTINYILTIKHLY